MKYKYNVISYKGLDVSKVEEKLNSNFGDDTVPTRSVEITGEHKTSKRISQCYLTHEEAKLLKNNNEVFDVELDIDERDDIFCEVTAVQDNDFKRRFAASTNLELTNYGLIRHTSREESLYDSTGEVSTDHSDNYVYNNTGHGVDIFILDTGVQGDHPDFNDAYGNSRVQKIDWTPYVEAATDFFNISTEYRKNLFKPENYYIETDNFHGTQCASISAGLRYGWAKNAHIYSCKQRVGSDNASYPESYQWLPIIKHFIETRKEQGIERPVIINCSFGLFTTGYALDEIQGGSYADENTERATWSRGNLTDNELLNNYRLTPSNKIGATLETTNTLTEELLDLGVHFVVAAGNNGIRQVKLDNPEYDNYLSITRENGDAVTLYPNRPSSPYADGVIYCGALDNYHVTSTGKEKIIDYSNRGNAVDIMAASEFCFCAISNLCTSHNRLRAHPEYPDQKIHSFGGTSCAAPQTVGVMALYLSQRPHLSPAALKEIIISESTKDIILSTGDYTTENSFLDTPNRVLYSKFNQNTTFSINNSASIRCANLGTEYKLKTNFKPESLTFGGRGVLPKGSAENYGVSSGFQNDDANMLYNQVKLKHLLFNPSYSGITLELGIDGDPSNINVHNWNALELYNIKNKVLVKLSRHDAVYDPVKQTFYWDTNEYNHTTTNGIFTYGEYTNNVIGII